MIRKVALSLRALLDRMVEVRPARSGRPHLHDWIEVAILVAVFSLAIFTPAQTSTGEPNAPLMESLERSTGGGLCLLKRVTGVPCPTCGMTRGFVQLAHLHPVDAVRLNPLVPAVFFLFASRLLEVASVCLLRREVQHRVPVAIRSRFWTLLIGGALVLGIYRLVAHLAHRL